MLKKQYGILVSKLEIVEATIPINKDIKGNTDLLLRYLDCAVIQDLHAERAKNKERPFDSVRGVFFEGNPIYETSGFREQSHIQICVRNPNCIKGFLLQEDLKKIGVWCNQFQNCNKIAHPNFWVGSYFY